MILDYLLFLDNTALAITTTTNSANIIDLQDARDLGMSNNGFSTLKFCTIVDTAFTTTNSGTLQIKIEGSTDSTTWTVYAESRAIAATALTPAGSIFFIDWPQRVFGDAMPRYMRAEYVVTNAFTAGKVRTFVVSDDQRNHAYPAGINITN